MTSHVRQGSRGEVALLVCPGCGATSNSRSRIEPRSRLWSAAGTCHLGDHPTETPRRYVDLGALLYHLRYVDWQEDTAADAIEAWAAA